ncbi:hypothetical protein BGX34_010151 [Mortierella sp. NVP85]|nr:hypothetical protein BGX34_010151 [Mortierella sp. NVP85]
MAIKKLSLSVMAILVIMFLQVALGSVTDESGRLLWSSKKTGPSDNYILVLSDKGVVRILKPDGEALSQWGGGKGWPQGIYTLSMNNDGSLIISDPHGKTVWSSKKK